MWHFEEHNISKIQMSIIKSVQRDFIQVHSDHPGIFTVFYKEFFLENPDISQYNKEILFIQVL